MDFHTKHSGHRAMNNVKKDCLKTSKQFKKILSKSVKNFISFQCNTQISNSKCSLLCTILCSMLRTSIFIQMYMNTRAGLRAHLSTPVYYILLKYRAMHSYGRPTKARVFLKHSWISSWFYDI